MGVDLCPMQMELFFAAKVRQWKSSNRKVCWCQPPFWYSPGPEAMKGSLNRIPVAALRRLLLVGLPVEEMQEWGVLEDCSEATFSDFSERSEADTLNNLQESVSRSQRMRNSGAMQSGECG